MTRADHQGGVCIVWFRRDLRVADNPALTSAVSLGGSVVPVFVADRAETMGGAQRDWLCASLAALHHALSALGLNLVVRQGPAATALAALAHETGAERVVWTRRIEPFAIQEQESVERALAQNGVAVESHAPSLLFDPQAIAPAGGGFYKVFGPFSTACRRITPARPLPAPTPNGSFQGVEGLASEPLFGPRPQDVQDDTASTLWTPGEAGAQARLARFIDSALAGYANQRDRLDRDGTSRLSPHLAWGEVSARQVWAAATFAGEQHASAPGVEKFLSELLWREFSHHLLHHIPTLPVANFRPAFDAFPWRTDEIGLAAWQQGRTGYPVVDAAMRQLRATGWMPNRARMVTASFLTKHLLIDWRAGEHWFRTLLVDADLASNVVNWQWVAGSGVDAAPYFRIFNPVTQAEKFDPDGSYVRQWVPELARLADPFVHRPGSAPAAELARAGVTLGETYPPAMVDHAQARKRALESFARMRR
jgi:deoxyribodipyrimidine photo-lyase